MHFKDILEAASNFTRGSGNAARKLPDHARSTMFYIGSYYASRAYS